MKLNSKNYPVEIFNSKFVSDVISLNFDLIPELLINNNKKIIYENKLDTQDKLYHLLTDSKTFYVNNIRFYDYNASIDLLLDKNKGKLLSMKYI